MGYDMTFHPITPDREGGLLLDFLRRKKSAQEISAGLDGCTSDLVPVVADILTMLLDEKDKRHSHLAMFISYRLGMLSAYHRPCWYARGRQGVSFMKERYPDVSRFVVPSVDWLGAEFAGYGDPSGGAITENFCGSGVITEVAEFKRWFAGHHGEGVFDREGRWAMTQCIDYCIAHGCHLVEVTDVYSPMAGASINVEKSVRLFRG